MRQRDEARQREREEADLIWEQGRGTWQQRLLEDVRLEVYPFSLQGLHTGLVLHRSRCVVCSTSTHIEQARHTCRCGP